MTDSVGILPPVAPGDTLDLANVFRVLVSTEGADRQQVEFELVLAGDTLHHSLFLRETLVAPVLNSAGIFWDDRPLGNGNGIAEAGEWLQARWGLYNTGSFRTSEISGSRSTAGGIPVDSVVFPGGMILEPGDTAQMTFQLRSDGTGTSAFYSAPFVAGDQRVAVADSIFVPLERHFEDFRMDPGLRFPFVNSSGAPWIPDPGSGFSTPGSYRSGPITDFGTSELSIRFTNSAPDTLFFVTRVSSETGYDRLRFYLDSVLLRSWSGEQGWEQVKIPVDSGAHEAAWIYSKDQSVSKGEDAAWIDNMIFPKSAFRGSDLSLVSINGPESGPWLTANESAGLVVRNAGEEVSGEFVVRFEMDHTPHLYDTVKVPLDPGGEVLIPLPGDLDLSSKKSYRLYGEVTGDGQEFTGNNRLNRVVEHYAYPDLAVVSATPELEPGVYADLLLTISNLGNVTIDSLVYESGLEGLESIRGSLPVELDPGNSDELRIRLADSTLTGLETRAYAYYFRSLVSDSVASNNELTGFLFWTVMGVKSPENPYGLLIYPNPAREGIHLVLSRPAAQRLRFSLISRTGQVLDQFFMDKGLTEIYVPLSLAEGSYYLVEEQSGDILPLIMIR